MKKIFYNGKYLILFLFLCFTFATVAYAGLSTQLAITGEADFRAKADIRVTDIELSSVDNGATLQYEPLYDVNSTTMGFILPNSNSSITYKVTVTNYGDIDQTIYSIITALSNNDSVNFSISGYEIKEVIGFQSTVSFYITFTTTSPSDQVINKRLEYEFRKVYKVYYDGEYENMPSTQIKYESEPLQLSDKIPKRKGYTFIGWSDSKEGETVKYRALDMYEIDKEIILYPKWETGKYVITLDNQEATTKGTEKVYLKYTDGVYIDENLENKMTTKSNPIVVSKKTGYTFTGYYTKTSDAGVKVIDESGYITTEFTNTLFTEDSTIYAKYRKNIVYIHYNVNSGKVRSPSDDGRIWTTTSDGDILLNGNYPNSKVSYGGNIGTNGLYDVDNLNAIYVTKEGYKAVSNEEWKCLSENCKRNTYDQASVYSASDFCDISEKDCTVTLGVNWTPNTYTITLDKQNGTDGTDTIYETYGSKYSLTSNGVAMNANANPIEKPTREGYTFNGYYTETSGGVQYINENGYLTANANTKNFTENGKLYARWTINKVHIRYSTNGGKITQTTKSSDGKATYTWTQDDGMNNGLISRSTNAGASSIYQEVIDYGSKQSSDGISNYNNGNYINITKLGYIGVSKQEWICLAGCTTENKKFNQSVVYNASDFCDASKGDCTVTLGVNWEITHVLYDYLEYITDKTDEDVNFNNENVENGLYSMTESENPIYYYRGDSTLDNNVVFANYCWKIVRTTDTNGVKLIFNGDVQEVTDGTGKVSKTCPGINTTISSSTFPLSGEIDSIASAGYMWGTMYGIHRDKNVVSNASKFGNNVTYDPTTYYTIHTNVNSVKGKWNDALETILPSHHYSCLSTANVCGKSGDTSVAYIFYYDSSKKEVHYIQLKNGKTLEDALKDMVQNTHNSEIKSQIDSWYEDNLIGYKNYLEDTTWCNDRQISVPAGFNPDGGLITDQYLYFSANSRFNKMTPSLSCDKNDSFTTGSDKGNGALSYPIGLLTVDEAIYAGASSSANSNLYLNNGINYWLMSSSSFDAKEKINMFGINSNGEISELGGDQKDGIRPSISLTHSTKYISGNGSKDTPYIIDTSEASTNNKNLSVLCENYSNMSECLENKNSEITDIKNVVSQSDLYRFQGNSNEVNDNYICFGTRDKEECLQNQDKYMYRIIGITSDGKIKVVKKEALDTAYSWWEDHSTDIKWPQSNIYNTLIGDEFLNNTNYLPDDWSSKIYAYNWRYGDIITTSTQNGLNQSGAEIYKIENGLKEAAWNERANEHDPGAIAVEVVSGDDAGLTIYYVKKLEKWGSTVLSKVGTLSASDYYLSIDNNVICLPDSNDSRCIQGWIHLSNNDLSAPNANEWIMLRSSYSTNWNRFNSYAIESDGFVDGNGLTNPFSVRPVFYIDSSIKITNGTGKSSNPYIIGEWLEDKYEISLNENGATVPGTSSITATYNFDKLNPSSITLPKKIGNTVSGFTTSDERNSTGATISNTKDLTSEYKFNGWYTSATDGIKLINESTTPKLLPGVEGYTDDIGSWMRKSGTILYASWSDIPNVIKLPTITKTGYTCGWTTNSSGLTIEYSSGANYTKQENATMYAVCTPKTYTITLNENNATTQGTSSIKATYDSSILDPSNITLPSRTYEVSGFTTSDERESTGAIISSTNTLTSTYTFEGWYTKSSNGIRVLSSSTIPKLQADISGYTDENSNWIRASNTALYAGWTSKAVTLPTITKVGYVCGWTESSTGATITYTSGENYTPTKNTTLYAVCDKDALATADDSPTFLNSTLSKLSIESVTFENSNIVPNDVKGSWDASNNENKSVMAWYKDDDNNSLYEVYIGQNGGVIANKNSSYLFYELTEIKELNLNNFDTSQVTNMLSMFDGMSSLTNLDVGDKFDTSNVTKMNYLFYNDSKLSTTITISNSEITVTGMFHNAATDPGAQITINYTSETEDLVEKIISQYPDSHLVKGIMVQ